VGVAFERLTGLRTAKIILRLGWQQTGIKVLLCTSHCQLQGRYSSNVLKFDAFV